MGTGNWRLCKTVRLKMFCELKTFLTLQKDLRDIIGKNSEMVKPEKFF